MGNYSTNSGKYSAVLRFAYTGILIEFLTAEYFINHFKIYHYAGNNNRNYRNTE